MSELSQPAGEKHSPRLPLGDTTQEGGDHGEG